MEGLKKEIFNETKCFAKQLDEFNESVDFVSNLSNEAINLIKEIKAENTEVKKELENIKDENTVLKQSVVELKEKVRDLEQYSRRTNIEISGIPQTAREEVMSIRA